MALSTAPIYAMGVMILPLEQEFGWARAEISFGTTIAGFASMLLTPAIGIAVDRFGPRRIGAAGSVMYCLAIAVLSRANADIWSWWLLWGGIAITGLFVGPTVWTAAVSRLFTEGRGFALAVTLCGTGIGSSLTPILSDYLVNRFGWRGAYVGLAGSWGLLTVPLILLCFRGGGPDTAGLTETPSISLPGFTAREGLRRASFYKIAVAALAICLVVVSFIVNLVPILTFTGHNRGTAAAIAAIVGVCSIVGRLTTGHLLDRLDPNRVAGVAVALPILSVLLLIALPASVPAAVIATMILGLSLGAELDVVAYLASRHLGMRSFGVLFGAISGLVSFGVGMGPVLVNYIYDTTRSYYPALWLYIPGCLISSALFLSLGRFPDFGRVRAADGGTSGDSNMPADVRLSGP